jgi:hypothetical protein
MEKEEVQADKKNRDSSIRWQGRTIEQFGYAQNLILGLGIASIGYEITLILNKDIERVTWQNCLLSISLLSFVISAGAAILCVVTRLRNFRNTADIARKREDDATKEELYPLRTKSKELGEFTWTLLWWQISAFSTGVLSLVIVFAGSLTVAFTK